MALIPGSDYETGTIGATEVINLKTHMPGSKVKIQSAFYGVNAAGKPIAVPVDPVNGQFVTVQVLPGIQGLSCSLITPSLAFEMVELGQPSTPGHYVPPFSTPPVTGGAGEGVVIIKGV